MDDSEKPAFRRKDPDPLGGRPPIDSLDIGDKTYVVAQVPPLDVTGVRTVTIGTVAWLVGFVALLPFYGRLEDSGNLWWLWTCLAGFGLGLMGAAYCRRRALRIARDPHYVPESSALGAAGL